jgi:hypothetical protein
MHRCRPSGARRVLRHLTAQSLWLGRHSTTCKTLCRYMRIKSPGVIAEVAAERGSHVIGHCFALSYPGRRASGLFKQGRFPVSGVGRGSRQRGTRDIPDVESEAPAQQALNATAEGRITVAATHGLTTVSNADMNLSLATVRLLRREFQYDD